MVADYFRFTFAYTARMGEMKRRLEWGKRAERPIRQHCGDMRSIIAALRLARDDITGSSPRLTCAVADSVSLARMILKRVMSR